MNNVSKRVFSLLLALIMVLTNVSGIATTAFATETEATEMLENEIAVVEEIAEEAEEEPAAEEPAAEEEPAEEPAEEPEEEPAAEEPAEEPVIEDPVEEPAEEPETEEPAEETPADEPAEDVQEEPAEGIVEEPAEGAADEDEVIEEVGEGSGTTVLEIGVAGLSVTYSDLVAEDNYGDGNPVAEWSVENNKITGTVLNEEWYNGGITTLTLTNNLSEEANLYFKWDASRLIGQSYITAAVYNAAGEETESWVFLARNTIDTTANGEKTLTMDGGAYVVVTMYCTETSAYTENLMLKIMDINLYVDVPVTATFKAVGSEQGYYLVNGEPITVDTVKTQKAAVPYTLEAVPAEGYAFSGWYSETTESFVSTEKNATVYLDKDQTVYPIFVNAENAVWGVGDACFTTLEDAIDCAERGENKVVALLRDYTMEGEVTIPAGITMLIPFDAENTCYTNKPEAAPLVDLDGDGYDNGPESYSAPRAYRTLTLAKNATLTVKGGLSVSAKHHPGGQRTISAPYGPCGFIETESGSEIVVANGGSLYAWGFIVGAGTVDAQSGSAVYENLQITDFRGGNASVKFVQNESVLSKSIFPFNQYYVQNVEVPLTIRHGAKEVVYISIYAAGGILSVDVDFIGTDISMFRIGEGSSITKAYDGTTDRMTITVNGNASVNGMAVPLDKFGMGEPGQTMDSSIFTLPITNNITIDVKSGTTAINQSVALLPGAEVNIAKNATLAVGEGWSVYVYDSAEWVGKGFTYPDSDMKPIVWSYANGSKVVRSSANLADAKVNVNGILEINGYLYTTQSGANIYSSEGTGAVVLKKGNGTQEYTWQVTQEDINVYPQDIPLSVGVQLKNGTEDYTSTNGAKVNGDAFIYNAASENWINTVTLSYDGNGGTGTTRGRSLPAMYVVYPVMSGREVNKLKLAENGFTGEYPFKEWNTKADGTGESYQPGDSFYVTGNVTLYAIWDKPAEYTVTWNVEGETATTTVVAGKVPSYGATNPTKAAEGCTSYTFAGWATSADGEAKTELPAATGPVTYYAIFTSKTEHSFTNKKGDEITAGNCMTEAVYALKCDNCDAVHETETIKGGKVADKHTGNNTVVGKVDATCGADGYTGDTVCECGVTIATGTVQTATGLHTYGKGLRGAEKTAGTCKAAAVYAAKCDNCVFENTAMSIYGEKDMENHVNKAVTYTSLDAENHKVFWSCCGTVVKEQEEHTYTDGTCVCNKVQTFAVTLSVSGRDDVAFKGGVAPVATYGQDLTVELVNLPYANGLTTRKDVFVSDFSYGKDNECVEKTADNGIFVIDKNFITGDITINAKALVEFTVNLQGGTLSELGKEFLTENEGIVTMPDSLYSCYQYEIEFGALDKYFTRDGYNLASFKDQNGETYAADDFVELNGDMHLTAVWECLHQKTEAVDNGDGKTHNIICTNPECNGTVINAQVAHNFENAEHKCVCGKVETYTVTFTINGEAYGEPVAVKYGDPITAPSYTAEEGYIFSGWDVPTVMPDKDITLDAKLEGKQYNVTVYNEYGQEDKITLSNTVATFGQDYVTTVSSTVGTGIGVWGIKLKGEEVWTGNGYEFDAETNTLTIPAEFVTDDLVLEVIPYVMVTTHLNGGAVTEEWALTYEPDDEGKFTMEWECGRKAALFYVYDEATDALIPDPNGIFELQHHTISAYNTAADGSGTSYALDKLVTLTEDTDIYLIWSPAKYTLTIYAMDFENGNDCSSIAVKVDVPYGALVKDYLPADCGEEWGNNPIYQAGEMITVAGKMYNGTWTITGWLGSDEVSVNQDIDLETFTMPAGGMEITQSYVFTGWVHNWFDENGNWLEKPNGTKYCVADEYIENTIAHIDDEAYLFDENGFIVAGAGLVRHVTEDDTVEYYYFCDAVGCEKGCTKASYTGFKQGIHWLYKDNGLLPNWDYSFDERGVIAHREDTTLNGLNDEGDKTIYFIDGVPAYMGLIEIDGAIYYVRSSGEIIKGKSYWISKTNGLKEEGAYYFDEAGKLVEKEAEKKNGIYEENGGLFYYKEGKLFYAGLIEIDGDYYYVRTNGKLAQNEKYWPTKMNDINMKQKSYQFDEDGKMVRNLKSGIFAEDDGLYYYENGVRTYAGLIQLDGNYYYVRSNGQLVQNQKYWVTKHNDLMLEGNYEFDAEGKIVFDQEPGFTGIKDGIYYENGMKTYAGLIEIDGEFYYVNSSCKVITGRRYWISKTNGHMPEGSYQFDAQGRLIG